VKDRSERGVGGDAGAAPERFSIGRFLAAQRELRGISLDELSARTKIPRRNLERLESGAFDAQSDGFVRGFVRTVALALGLDSNEVMMRMSGEPAGADEDALWRRRMRVALLTAVLGGLALIALGLGLRQATRWIVEPAGGPPDHVFRRDAVRSLADRQHEKAGARAGEPDAPPAER
jgi:hypothetical protein